MQLIHRAEGDIEIEYVIELKKEISKQHLIQAISSTEGAIRTRITMKDILEEN